MASPPAGIGVSRGLLVIAMAGVLIQTVAVSLSLATVPSGADPVTYAVFTTLRSGFVELGTRISFSTRRSTWHRAEGAPAALGPCGFHVALAIGHVDTRQRRVAGVLDHEAVRHIPAVRVAAHRRFPSDVDGIDHGLGQRNARAVLERVVQRARDDVARRQADVELRVLRICEVPLTVSTVALSGVRFSQIQSLFVPGRPEV